nr:uncharacterized protein LOC127319759 [Lolium perenne]
MISAYCLMKIRECRIGQIYDIGFVDPYTVHEHSVQHYPKDTEDNLVSALRQHAHKREILFSYNFSFHFILLVIEPAAGVVEVMDSKSKPLAAWGDMADILQRACKRFTNKAPGVWKSELELKPVPVVFLWASVIVVKEGITDQHARILASREALSLALDFHVTDMSRVEQRTLSDGILTSSPTSNLACWP